MQWKLPKAAGSKVKLSKTNQYLEKQRNRLLKHWSQGNYRLFWKIGMSLVNKSLSFRLLALHDVYQSAWYIEWSVNKLTSILKYTMNREVMKQPIKRKYILKPNGKLRPLGIPATIGRIYFNMINRLFSLVISEIISPNQFGFQPGESIYNAWIALKDILLKYGNSKIAIFESDLTKCFDQLTHNKILSSLKELLHVPHELISYFKQVLAIPTLFEGKLFPNVVGTPQGLPISPVLALLSLQHSGLFQAVPNYIGFADDAVVPVLEKDLEETKRTLLDWPTLKEFGIEFNYEKSITSYGLNITKFLGFQLIEGFVYRYSNNSLKNCIGHISEISKESLTKEMSDTRKPMILKQRKINPKSLYSSLLNHWTRTNNSNAYWLYSLTETELRTLSRALFKPTAKNDYAKGKLINESLKRKLSKVPVMKITSTHCLNYLLQANSLKQITRISRKQRKLTYSSISSSMTNCIGSSNNNNNNNKNP